MSKIVDDINEIMRQMKEYGLKESTLNLFYYGIFKPIINLHHKQGKDEYEELIVQNFYADYEKRLKVKAVTQSHFVTVARAVKFLISYEQTNVVDFSFPKRDLQVIPSEYHMNLIRQCLAACKSGGSKKEINIGVFMRHLFCFAEKTIGDDGMLTDEIAQNFIIVACKKYPGSIGNIMLAVRELTSYLRSESLMNSCVDYAFFTPKGPPTKMQIPFSSQEIEAMLNSCDLKTSIGKRDRAMILLGYGDGLRAGDIVKLTFEDIDWNTGTLHITQGKTGKILTLTLNPTTMNAIADYILYGRPKCDSRNIFLTAVGVPKPISSGSRLSSRLNEISKNAGVEIVYGRAFHAVRRAYAINLAESDVPLSQISEMLGHSNYSVDRQYLTFNRDQTQFCALDFQQIPVSSSYYSTAEESNEFLV